MEFWFFFFGSFRHRHWRIECTAAHCSQIEINDYSQMQHMRIADYRLTQMEQYALIIMFGHVLFLKT